MKRKDEIVLIKGTIIIYVAFYMMFSFVETSFNFLLWSYDARVLCMMFSSIASVFFFIMYVISKI